MTDIKKARAYISSSIQSFDGDPADSDFQEGYLAALYVIGKEALGMDLVDPSIKISEAKQKIPHLRLVKPEDQ